MQKIKVIKTEFMGSKGLILRYRLITDCGKIKLKIDSSNIEKQSIIRYTKCPFYIVIDKDINNLIEENDYFEVSTCEDTISMECNSSCRVGL